MLLTTKANPELCGVGRSFLSARGSHEGSLPTHSVKVSETPEAQKGQGAQDRSTGNSLPRRVRVRRRWKGEHRQ